jgi:hypothetical protein
MVIILTTVIEKSVNEKSELFTFFLVQFRDAPYTGFAGYPANPKAGYPVVQSGIRPDIKKGRIFRPDIRCIPSNFFCLVILVENNSSSGFFASWARHCMVEQGWVKPLASFHEQVSSHRYM